MDGTGWPRSTQPVDTKIAPHDTHIKILCRDIPVEDASILFFLEGRFFPEITVSDFRKRPSLDIVFVDQYVSPSYWDGGARSDALEFNMVVNYEAEKKSPTPRKHPGKIPHWACEGSPKHTTLLPLECEVLVDAVLQPITVGWNIQQNICDFQVLMKSKTP